jgi:hypothetical protein
MAFSLHLLDLVLPRRCAACGGGEELLCAACRAALRRLEGPLCARCGAPSAWPVQRCRECAGRRIPFVSARAAVAYDGPARPLVAAWKERGLRPLAREFSALVAEIIGCSSSDPRVRRSVASIQAQSVSYLPHPIAARVGFSLKPTTRAQVEAVANHIAEFSVAGVRQIARRKRRRAV